MALGKNIRRHRTAAGLTLEQLAMRAGVEVGTISALENRDSERSKYGTKIAQALGVTLEQLELGASELQLNASTHPPIDLDDNPDYPAIRRVRFKLSAGASGFGVEYLDEQGAPIVFQRQWYEQRGFAPDKLFAVKVANGSMEPGLFDGDTVVVNTAQSEPRDGVVFAVNYEGELVIKRLVRDAGQWWLCSDNPDQRRYPRKVCHEGTHILGEIVHKQSERL